MEHIYRMMTNDQLITKLLATEREKEQLSEFITRLQLEIEQLKKKISVAGNYSFWDGAFSNNYHYQIVNEIQEITRIDNKYQYFPGRSKKLIRGIKSFKITTPAVHMWIGVGTRNMAPNGFPGYTPEAWMIDTGGQLYHNNVHVLTNHLIKFSNKTVIVKVDVPNASLTIDGVTQRLGDNLPAEVYFVIAVRDHSKKILFQELE